MFILVHLPRYPQVQVSVIRKDPQKKNKSAQLSVNKPLLKSEDFFGPLFSFTSVILAMVLEKKKNNLFLFYRNAGTKMKNGIKMLFTQ